ncbi:VWA domain-containing protein [Candidatus Margulisiibacteriota bacterium]
MNIVYWPFLWILLALPTAVIAYFIWIRSRDKKLLAGFGDIAVLSSLQNRSLKAVKFKQVLFVAALVLILIAILRPQWGLRKEQVSRRGLDIIFALDVSASMRAEDIQPDRLSKSIMEIKKILPLLSGDRAGLVTFAGSATSIMPLTLDYGALEMFLGAIKNYSEATPGTNLEQAYQTAVKMFDFEAPQDKLLLMFTDGESHEGNLDALRNDSRSKGIIVIPVAVGSKEGQPVPEVSASGVRQGYKKTKKEEIVISHLDIENLKKIATIGPYVIDSDEKTVVSIVEDIKHYKRSKLAELRVSIYTERYQWFLLMGLLLLLVSYGVNEEKGLLMEMKCSD